MNSSYSFAKYFLAFIAGLSFSAGLVFAWNAAWHGTDWIKTGAVIDAKKIAENFEFLYRRAGKLPVSCPNVGDVLQWSGSGWECVQAQTGGTGACSAQSTLLNSDKTAGDCMSIGGTPVQTENGCVCKLSANNTNACPDGWTFNGWTETQNNVCGATSCSLPPGCWSNDGCHTSFYDSCNTDGHVFAPKNIETCTYTYNSHYWQCDRSTRTCYANVVAIGCK